mgnify:CR=1 FL=1
MTQVRFGRPKVLRTQPNIRLVTRKTQIADRQFQPGHGLMQHRLPVIAMLHAFTQLIADKADVGVGTIYNYFSSKNEILLNIIADIFLEKKPHKLIHENDPAQTVIRFLGYYMDEFSIFEKEIWRGWFAALFQEPNLFERAYELDMKIVGELAGICEEMQAKGMMTDKVPPLEIAKLLYTPFISLVMSYIMLEDMDIHVAKKEFESQVMLIFRGLFP